MRLYDKEGRAIPAYKTRKPKFADGFRRTWDHEVVTIDGKEYKFYLDTTWGKAWYFLYVYNWYKIPFYLHGRLAYVELDPMYVIQEGGVDLYTINLTLEEATKEEIEGE